jgi:succinoglycan biosynthesis transport protein ExoP
VLTSSHMAEGKSTTAANMAVSMAQSGKNVLLIDADLRKPRVHRYFNLSNDIGLTDIVVKNVSTEEAIKKFSYVENLSIICSGSVPPNPTEILESKKLAELLQELKEKFDIVIIDTPPVGQLTDGAILASIADGVILVAASGESNIDMVRRARAALMQVNANIIGVVLTKINKTRSGSYYTYYNYDKYYGSED